MPSDNTALIPDRWVAAFNARHHAESVRDEFAMKCRVLFTDVPSPPEGFHFGLLIDPAGPMRVTRDAAPASVHIQGTPAALARGLNAAINRGPPGVASIWPELAQHIKVVANPEQAALIVTRVAAAGANP